MSLPTISWPSIVLPSASSPSPSSQPQQDQTNLGAILGGVLSGVSLIGTILSLLLLWWYLHDRKVEKKIRGGNTSGSNEHLALDDAPGATHRPRADLEKGAVATRTVPSLRRS